jgi:hypothetical protein
MGKLVGDRTLKTSAIYFPSIASLFQARLLSLRLLLPLFTIRANYLRSMILNSFAWMGQH